MAIYKLIKKLLRQSLFLILFKIPISLRLINKNNAVFFCGNKTIGDNVILLSLVKSFCEVHHPRKIYYYSYKNIIDSLIPLYLNYKDIIVWKTVRKLLFEKIILNQGCLIKLIDLCNKHKENAFHSIFYLKEKIPSNMTVIEYQKFKMRLPKDVPLFLPEKVESIKKKQIILNINSQTVKPKSMISIANRVIKYCNEHKINVYINDKNNIFDGHYYLVYPSLKEWIYLVESSILLVSVRTGLVDLVVNTSTPKIVIYEKEISDDFSFIMWGSYGNNVIEIVEDAFSTDLLKNLID